MVLIRVEGRGTEGGRARGDSVRRLAWKRNMLKKLGRGLFKESKNNGILNDQDLIF